MQLDLISAFTVTKIIYLRNTLTHKVYNSSKVLTYSSVRSLTACCMDKCAYHLQSVHVHVTVTVRLCVCVCVYVCALGPWRVYYLTHQHHLALTSWFPNGEARGNIEANGVLALLFLLCSWDLA